MNRVTIIGNLTKDPDSRTTKDGKHVCNFTVAVNRRKKADGTQEVDFFRVSTWNNLADSCQKYLAKGRKVAVVGSISASCYTPEGGEPRGQMDVLASDVEFLTPNGSGQNGEAQTAPSAEPVAVEDPDELPF